MEGGNEPPTSYTPTPVIAPKLLQHVLIFTSIHSYFLSFLCHPPSYDAGYPIAPQGVGAGNEFLEVFEGLMWLQSCFFF